MPIQKQLKFIHILLKRISYEFEARMTEQTNPNISKKEYIVYGKIFIRKILRYPRNKHTINYAWKTKALMEASPHLVHLVFLKTKLFLPSELGLGTVRRTVNVLRN